MDNNIKVDIITLEDGKQFTVYDGNNEKDANQSEKFASLIVDKSKEPSIMVRTNKLDSSDPTDEVDGKMLAEITKSINRMTIDLVINTLKGIDKPVTVDDIDAIDFIKDDRDIDGRIVVYYSADDGSDKILINGINNGIVTSRSHSYAKVLLMDCRLYHIYFYYNSNNEICACVSEDIEAIWEKMDELGYSNSYISFITNSNPYEIEDHCGSPVEKTYIDMLMNILGEAVMDDLLENEEDEEDEEDDR